MRGPPPQVGEAGRRSARRLRWSPAPSPEPHRPPGAAMSVRGGPHTGGRGGAAGVRAPAAVTAASRPPGPASNTPASADRSLGHVTRVPPEPQDRIRARPLRHNPSGSSTHACLKCGLADPRRLRDPSADRRTLCWGMGVL